MHRPRTLQCFTPEQVISAHRLLASTVARMMGRKLEENDWTEVYNQTLGIPPRGWSNLNIDVMHNGLGVEQKMLKVRQSKTIKEYRGQTLMHPSATRSFRISKAEYPDPEDAKDVVLQQYGELVNSRRAKLLQLYPDAIPDLRTGWLLWQESLEEFLYFEEEMLVPNPSFYVAEWNTNPAKGTRKASTSLWIYEKESGKKRYSVTTDAGAKIQPYFDVPPPSDPNVHIFRVQGEPISGDMVRVWLTATTLRELQTALGSLDPSTLGNAVAALPPLSSEAQAITNIIQPATPISVPSEVYFQLKQRIHGVSDEHVFSQFAEALRQSRISEGPAV